MKESGIYIPLWQKYKAAIVSKLKSSIESQQDYQLSKHEFEAIGDRPTSGYSFNLEINKGMLANDIGGSAVARDLFEVLKQSVAAKELLKEHHFKIRMTTNFILVFKAL